MNDILQPDNNGNPASRSSRPQQPKSHVQGFLCGTFGGFWLFFSVFSMSGSQEPQLGWSLSGFGSNIGNSGYIDGIVSDLIQVSFFLTVSPTFSLVQEKMQLFTCPMKICLPLTAMPVLPSGLQVSISTKMTCISFPKAIYIKFWLCWQLLQINVRNIQL